MRNQMKYLYLSKLAFLVPKTYEKTITFQSQLKSRKNAHYSERGLATTPFWLSNSSGCTYQLVVARTRPVWGLTTNYFHFKINYTVLATQ